MGLLTSVNNLSYTLEEEKRNKKLEQIRRQRERQQKEDLKRYKNEIEMYIKKEFDKYFEIAGSDYIVEFYNRERKKEILNNYFDTIKTIDKNGFETIPYKNELEQHFYNKYNTILTKAQKEQKQQELYNLQQMPIEEELEKLHIDWLKVAKILFTIAVAIIFLPITFLLAILFGCMKVMN